MPGHFFSTAQQVNYPVSRVEQMMSEIKEKTEQVITNVQAELPPCFPEKIGDAIFSGLRRQAAKLP